LKLKHLDGFFAGQRIATINPARLTAYVTKRQEGGAANATISRELETVGKMLRLASENNKLVRLPIIHIVQPCWLAGTHPKADGHIFRHNPRNLTLCPQGDASIS
jgi:hypothetical protein